MGVKGARKTAAAEGEAKRIVALLAPLGIITCRAMFGGYGVFADARMFGLVTSAGVLHLKVDGSNQAAFEKLRATRHGKMPYYSVPAAVSADTRKLRALARSSIAAE